MIKKITILIILVLSLFLFTACGGDEKVNEAGTTDIVDEEDKAQNTTTITSQDTTTTTDTSTSKYDTSKAVTTPEGCYDSDGGSFDKVLGFILDTAGTRFEDECVNQFSVKEYYCGSAGYKSDKIINCKFECKNGICVEGESDTNCIDSDYYDKFTKGTVTYKGETKIDYCEGNKLIEQVCSNLDISTTKDYICTAGCSNGRCNPEIDVDQSADCTDVDMGPDAAFTKTNVVDKKGTWSDECLNIYEVKEYYCNNYGFHTDKNIKCVNGCEDGACVR